MNSQSIEFKVRGNLVAQNQTGQESLGVCCATRHYQNTGRFLATNDIPRRPCITWLTSWKITVDQIRQITTGWGVQFAAPQGNSRISGYTACGCGEQERLFRLAD